MTRPDPLVRAADLLAGEAPNLGRLLWTHGAHQAFERREPGCGGFTLTSTSSTAPTVEHHVCGVDVEALRRTGSPPRSCSSLPTGSTSLARPRSKRPAR